MFRFTHLLILLVTYINIVYSQVDDTSYSSDFHYDVKINSHEDTRYLLYSVNPGEGFNLRRDVYMRIANLAVLLNQETREHWVLVLPPWGNLYHWRDNRNDDKIQWSRFFDLESLERLTPVMEFHDYIKQNPVIDKAYYLQEFKEGWRNGEWEERIEQRPCIGKTDFVKNGDHWNWHFWGYGEKASVASFSCLSVQLEYKNMVKFLNTNANAYRSFLMARSEIFPSLFAGGLRWSTICNAREGRGFNAWNEFGMVKDMVARRSMRFSKKLVQQANLFRKVNFNSTDEDDDTVIGNDWTQTRKKKATAVGGSYLAVHLRRRDYHYAHPDVVPSLGEAAKRIIYECKRYKVDKVFIASDAEYKEIKELKLLMKDLSVFTYNGIEKDGSRAIIDQIICSHARYFVGTSHSTFSFRIQEERQILGFPMDSTYNAFCKNFKSNCDQPSKWPIQY